MTRIEIIKKTWLVFSQLIAVLFLIFISLGTISDNIPKITSLYKTLFPNKIEFSMNSENSELFKIKSTLNADYEILDNFIKINTNNFAIQYERGIGKPYTEDIGFIRIGIAKYTNSKEERGKTEIYSQEINLNKTILYNGSIIIKPKEFIIPRAKIKDLTDYWIVMQIGNLIAPKVGVSSVYAHSDKNIFNSK